MSDRSAVLVTSIHTTGERENWLDFLTKKKGNYRRQRGVKKSKWLERGDIKFPILCPALAVANILPPSLLLMQGSHTLRLPASVSLTVKLVFLILSAALPQTYCFQSHPYLILLYVCLLSSPVNICMLLLRLVLGLKISQSK